MIEKIITRVNEEDPEWTFEQWLDRGRQWWKASAARIIECDLLLVLNSANVVMAVGQVEGVKKDLDSGSGRVSIEVRPLRDSDWIGKEIERYASRNPAVYMSEIREVS